MVSEKWDETKRKVRMFMTDTLELPHGETLDTERARRLRAQRNCDRPTIIVKSSRFSDKSSIIQYARSKLRDSNWSLTISEYFMSWLRSVRNILGAYGVRARNSNKSAALSFDKLIIDDKIYNFNEETQEQNTWLGAKTLVSAHGVKHA